MIANNMINNKNNYNFKMKDKAIIIMNKMMIHNKWINNIYSNINKNNNCYSSNNFKMISTNKKDNSSKSKIKYNKMIINKVKC